MNKIVVTGITILTILSLAGCSTNKSASSKSSSSSASSSTSTNSSSSSAKKEMDKHSVNFDDIEKAAKIDNQLASQYSSKRLDAEQKDAHIRFSDITNNNDPIKYLGTAKLVGGRVFQIQKGDNGFKYIYFTDNENPNHVWMIMSSKKGIRVDDSIMVHATVVGRFDYTAGKNNRIVKSVSIIAFKKNIQNNGAYGK